MNMSEFSAMKYNILILMRFAGFTRRARGGTSDMIMAMLITAKASK